MMIKKSVGNKAEITTNQIVVLIILIVSFAIIIFFLSRLDLGKTSEKEVCRNSVLLKSSSEGAVGSLNCKTSYVCISGGEECEGFSSTRTIKIKLYDEERLSKESVLNATADELSDCWWMFGNGEIKDYTGWGITELGKQHCGICSIMQYDKTIQDKLNSPITYDEFYNFLKNKKIKDSSENYLTYLYGVSDTSALLDKGIPRPEESFVFNKKYLVVTGISGDDFILPQFRTSEELTSNSVCELYDLTKA